MASAASVQQVEDAVEENEEVTTPPDELVACEVDSIENHPTASTSSSTASLGPSRLHIQKPRAKKMTETAKQRQEMHKSFLSILEKDQSCDIKPDDEIDSSFFGYANTMHLHLNQDQKEDVLQEINKVVTQAINNVRAGLPAVNKAPMYVPPVPPLQQATTPLVQQLGPAPGQDMGNPQQDLLRCSRW